jgi:hypothetical protein
MSLAEVSAGVFVVCALVGASRRAPFVQRFTRQLNFGEIGANSPKPFAGERLWSVHVEACRSEGYVLPIRSNSLHLSPILQFMRCGLMRGAVHAASGVYAWSLNYFYMENK